MSSLYIVPTPIGNLEDITYRAVKILQEADVILAEDTRKTSILMKKFQISKRLLSHHKFNESLFITQIIRRIKKGESVALVSNAGTPLISDPGLVLVRKCIEMNIRIECLPGPTALIPALVLSGFSTEPFSFEGFLPHKKGRKKRLQELSNEKRTLIFYESPHRLLKTLQQFAEFFGPERQASLSKELTKVYEWTFRDSLEQIIQKIQQEPVKGEYVIVVEGKK